MRKVTVVLITGTLALGLIPTFAGPVRAEDLSRCGAIRLDERPPLGKTGRWNDRPYVRRHNRFLDTHADVFASGYLAGKHFYVGFTQEVCKNLREFRRGLPDRWRIRAFKANFTYLRLRRAQRCVTELFSREWLGISAVGADVYRNKTSVMLERNSKRRRRFIRNECGTSARPILYFEEGTVSQD